MLHVTHEDIFLQTLHSVS